MKTEFELYGQKARDLAKAVGLDLSAVDSETDLNSKIYFTYLGERNGELIVKVSFGT